MPNKATSTTQTLGLTKPSKLEEKHDCTQFDSGQTEINTYLQGGLKQQKLKNSSIYVVCKVGTLIVKGYYTLSSAEIIRDAAPGNLKRGGAPKELSAIKLGRLGVDKDFQGKGYGKDLLQDAVERCIKASAEIASKAIIVDALDNKANKFYQNAGFKPVDKISKLTLYLSLI